LESLIQYTNPIVIEECEQENNNDDSAAFFDGDQLNNDIAGE